MAPLVDHWLEGEPGTPILDEASVSEVRTLVRSLGTPIGDREFAESCALIASELAQNQLRHAGGGRFSVRAIERDGVAGLEITAADAGPGIPFATFHRKERPSSGSLGAGLSAVRRLAHELDFDLREREGSCIRARRFVRAAGARREVAIAGRPGPDSEVSGDHAVFARIGERLMAAVIDGVGHGPLAREVSDDAGAEIRDCFDAEPSVLMAALEPRLRRRRGCIFSRVVLDESRMELSHFGVGNATTILTGLNSSRRFVTITGIVGQPLRTRRLQADEAGVQPGEIIIMHTDGLTSHVALAETPELFYRPAIAVATHLLDAYARGHDDALVLVVK